MCLVIYQCCFLCNDSRADFSEEPAFHHSKILFCNGYAFDEFFPDVIASSIDCAIDSGTAVFFDPGPRGKSLLHGTLDEQRALEHALSLSDVLLLTSDEVSWHTCCSFNLLLYSNLRRCSMYRGMINWSYPAQQISSSNHFFMRPDSLEKAK